MNKIAKGHVFIATSLDGYIARKDGSIERLDMPEMEGEDQGYNEFIKKMDCLVMGKNTFEKVCSFDFWPYHIPVIVMSSSLTDADIPGDLKAKVRISTNSPSDLMASLQSEGMSDVYVDGGRVVQSFLKEGLIVDMVISTMPVLLGDGIPLFGNLEDDVFCSVIKSKVFPSGLVQTTYGIKDKVKL